jgi:hypothetical protein
MFSSGDNDGSPRNRRPISPGKAFLDEGDSEFHYGVYYCHYARVCADGCGGIVTVAVGLQGLQDKGCRTRYTRWQIGMVGIEV